MKNLVVVMLMSALASTGCAGPITSRLYPTELEQINAWHGDYPTVHLGRFPEDQQGTPTGFFGSAEAFSHMWLVFKPADPIPAIDFRKNIVVFTRNTRYYNQTHISRVLLKSGVAQIVALETRSATPVTDRVSLALAVVPRAGIRYIRVGEKGRIPVAPP